MDGFDHSAPAPELVFSVRQPVIPASILFPISDLIAIQLIILFSVLTRKLLAPVLPIDLHPSNFRGVQLGALALPIVYALGGLYPGYGIGSVQRLQSRVSLTALSLGAMVLFDYLAQKGQWSRGILLVAGSLAIVVLPIWDAVVIQFLIRRRLWGTPVAVFGPVAQRRIVTEALRRQPELGWLPAAEGNAPNAPLGRNAANLAIVLAEPGQSFDLKGIEELPYPKVVIVPPLDDAQSLWVSVRDLGGLIGLEMRRNLLMPVSQIVKRSVDIALVTAAAPFVGVIVLIFAAIVRLISPGPVFFMQDRGGKNGQSFKIVKLRSMVADAETRLKALLDADPAAREEWARSMKLTHDPRIVPVIGQFMRRFSIDELPQLWNVLRGNMSLVGPRPLPQYHLDALSADACRLRARVRPGVTGLWQVSGRSELDLDDLQRLDIYYVRNWSLWLDIHILGRTLLVVMKGRGAR